MNSIKWSLTVVILGAIFTLSSIQTFAAQEVLTQETASQALVRLEILQKDAKGSLRLKDKAKRSEFITMVNAAMSYDVEADSADVDAVYPDLTKKHPAYKQVKAAVAHGLASAYEDGTIRPDKVISTGDAIVILLKALGYSTEMQGLDHEKILEKATVLGITGTKQPKYDDQLTRGNAAILIYKFLTIDFAESNQGE